MDGCAALLSSRTQAESERQRFGDLDLKRRDGSNVDMRWTGRARCDTTGGSRLAQAAGDTLHSPVTVISYQGQLTPLGPVPTLFHFQGAGIFESGLYDLDSTWAFTTLASAQRVFDLADVVNSIEIRLDNI